jgi:hypothetical protein
MFTKALVCFLEKILPLWGFWNWFASNIDKVASFPYVLRSTLHKYAIVRIFSFVVVDGISVFVG